MTRKRSLRWHQAKVDEVLSQVERGKMSPADGLKRVNIIKASAEIHIVQRQLELQGIGAPVDITPAPEEEFSPSPVIPYRSQRATVTEAVGPQGATSTKTVVIDSSGRDDEALDRAEVEALT